MKNKLKIGMGIIILSMGIMAIGCKGSSQKEATTTNEETAQAVYTCPMHPEVEQSEPGKCPTCGMELVMKDASMHHTDMHMSDSVYTCPMHPDVEKYEPGTCPECGMDLVLKDMDMEHSNDGQMHE